MTMFCVVRRLFAMALLFGAMLIPVSASADKLIFNTQEFSPFAMTKGGQVVGPAAEIIRQICQDISVQCDIKSYPWSRSQNNVKAGKGHGLFVIGWNEERAKWLHFSPPLLNTEYGFFVNESNNSTFSSLQDFDGLKVGVFGPSNVSRNLHKMQESTLKQIKIDMTVDDVPAFKKLASGRVDAVYSNREVGFAIIKENNIKGLKYAMTHKPLHYYIGFSMQHTPQALVDKFMAQFKAMHQQGGIQSVLSKYGMQAAELK